MFVCRGCTCHDKASTSAKFTNYPADSQVCKILNNVSKKSTFFLYINKNKCDNGLYTFLVFSSRLAYIKCFFFRMIVDVSKSVLVLSTQAVIKLLRSKEASNVVDIKSWPMILDTDDMPKKKLPVVYRAPTAEMLAYLDFSVSTTGMLAGIKMSHAAVTNLCKSMKLACELYPSRHIALCLDPYCGLGFALW